MYYGEFENREYYCFFFLTIRYNNARQWLTIDLGTISRVKRIATQGRYDADHWVTSYTVGFGMDNIKFYPYKEGRGVKVRRQSLGFTLISNFWLGLVHALVFLFNPRVVISFKTVSSFRGKP